MRIEPFIKIAKEVEALNSGEELEKYVKKLHGTEMFDFLVMYAKSLYLFTAGNVPSVRDFSLYDPKKAQFNRQQVPALVRVISDYTDEISYGAPSKMDYRIAGMVLKALAQSRGILAKPAPVLYRGVHSLSAPVYLALCKPGETYNIGNLASTSLIPEIAENFSEDGTRWHLTYYLNNRKAKKGVYTSQWTSGFPLEDEVILGGNIKVVGFSWRPNWAALKGYYGVTPQEINDMNNLTYFVNVFEHYIKDRKGSMLTGTTNVFGEIL